MNRVGDTEDLRRVESTAASEVGHGPRLAAAAAARRHGMLAGVLFVAASITSLPSTFLLDPGAPAITYVLIAMSVVIGIVCIRAPWDRISPIWLNLPPLLGTIHISLVVAMVDRLYTFQYLFVVIYVAYVFRDRLTVAAHVTAVYVAMLAPVVYDPEMAREAVREAALWIPTLGIAAAAIVYLREQLEARERTSQRFAREALAIASRLRAPEADAPLQTAPGRSFHHHPSERAEGDAGRAQQQRV
jgi:hypothetical protein